MEAELVSWIQADIEFFMSINAQYRYTSSISTAYKLPGVVNAMCIINIPTGQIIIGPTVIGIAIPGIMMNIVINNNKIRGITSPHKAHYSQIPKEYIKLAYNNYIQYCINLRIEFSRYTAIVRQ